MDRRENLRLFRKLFGNHAKYAYSAAGRVNIIGEHIDYCGGRVMPAALSLRCEVYARANGTDRIRIAATTYKRVVTLEPSSLGDYKDLPWGSYQAGVAYALKSSGHKLVGCDLLIDCTVPFGSGLSSSAAIEVACAVAMTSLAGETIDPVEAALIARKAENEYCGVSCGIMDQFASAMGKRGYAVLLDCATLDYEYVPLDLGDYALIIMDSNKRHSLTDGKYNERRAETDEALSVLAPALGIKCLAEVKESDLGRCREMLRPEVYKRVKHVAKECARVDKAADALRRGDMERLGELLCESDASLRELYEVTGKELDALTAAAGRARGCIGARMTGAGFGGSAIALVKKSEVAAFRRKVARDYERATGLVPAFYRTTTDDGIKREDLSDQYVSDLIGYAREKLGLKAEDETYAVNRVLRFMGKEDFCVRACCAGADVTASEIVGPLAEYAAAIHDGESEEYLETELFDCVSLAPSAVTAAFRRAYARNKERAFDRFYDYCVACDYVKSEAIARNLKWTAEGTRRKIEVTINLSKPEKDNKQTAKLRSVSFGYPKCMICAENEGYAGQGRCRQTLRILPMEVDGKEWFWQFSPYAYFYQHGIAINRTHTPMTLDDGAIDKLADISEIAPFYFIGCNAPLPIVGGSILAHEHFQGGKHFFPMFGCGDRATYDACGAKVSLLDWYNSVVCVRTPDRGALRDAGNRILAAWADYSAPELDIIARDGEQHNTATVIVRRDGDDYVLYEILRNNRCDDRYPDGIFHVHPEYMNIKKESIGLIEAMGMFILPARLKRELGEIEKILTGSRSEVGEDLAAHYRMIKALTDRYGTAMDEEGAKKAVRRAVDEACEHILENTAVFKEDERGQAAFDAFVRSALGIS